MSRDFINVLKERGFFYQCTNLEALLSKKKITGYVGYDPTARSLHVGNLLSIMMLRWLQNCGHRPIVLVGGATSRIGDPTGKDALRKTLSPEQIQSNIEGISQVFSKILDPKHMLLVNNDDWFSKINYIEFLSSVGRHFSVNRMLSFDSVKTRLEREQPMSFIEFNYMLLQGYDFTYLRRHFDCELQMGGSDQWGNIVSGVELTRRMDGKEVFGWTAPLITNSSGEKMGKTVSGAVWLNPDMLSPYDYWQFWRNTADMDVGRYLRLFTELPLSEITKLEALRDAEINEAKKILADEATKIVHGPDCLEAIHQTTAQLFEQKSGGGTLNSLPQVSIAASELPCALDALYVHAGLCESKGEAKRLIQGGGARLNDEPMNDIKEQVDITHFKNGQIKLSSGRKKHVVVKLI